MMSKNLFASLLAALCLSALAPPVFAGDAFDVDAATQAYLDRVPADVKANSDAYFEGGYWLVLVDFILGAALSLFLLAGKWSARMRNLAERISGRRAIQTFLYWCQYVLATTIILFPITIYEGYFREHKYGFSNQTLGEWLGDQGKGLLLDIFFGGSEKLVDTWGGHNDRVHGLHDVHWTGVHRAHVQQVY
jgi:STE24 endopeptidase